MYENWNQRNKKPLSSYINSNVQNRIMAYKPYNNLQAINTQSMSRNAKYAHRDKLTQAVKNRLAYRIAIIKILQNYGLR